MFGLYNLGTSSVLVTLVVICDLANHIPPTNLVFIYYLRCLIHKWARDERLAT